MDGKERERFLSELGISAQSQNALYTFLENAPDAVYICDLRGQLLYGNKRAEEISGYRREEVLGKWLLSSGILSPEDEGRVERRLRFHEMGKATGPDEFELIKKDGSRMWIEIDATPIDVEGQKVVLGRARDITKRKLFEHRLAASETRYRRLFETAQDGILILDADSGRIVDVNPFLIDMLGYSKEEFLGKRLWEIGPFKDIELSQQAFAELQSKGYVRYEHLPLLTKKGKRVSVEFVSNIYRVDGTKVIQCNIRNITDRKLVEDALAKSTGLLEVKVKERTADLTRSNERLVKEIRNRKQAESELRKSEEQLRNLSRRLDSMIEKEREQISREVHDELGQALVALQMDLHWVENRLPEGQESLREKTESMLELIGMTSQTVRNISTRLRPRLLDDLGIVAAIEWQMKEFQARTGIKYRIVFSPRDIMLDVNFSIVIFRTLQEALTNIALHANATSVRVSLKKRAREVLLEVRDNGRGISEEAVVDPKALGLVGIRERARTCGGRVTINGIPGKGTTLMLSVPVS